MMKNFDFYLKLHTFFQSIQNIQNAFSKSGISNRRTLRENKTRQQKCHILMVYNMVKRIKV